MGKTKKFKYFHEGNFIRIQNLIRDNRLESALIEFEQYLTDYPDDCCGKAYYADLLMKLGKFHEAKEVLDSIVVNKKTPDLSKQDISLMRLKLYSCMHRYEEALEVFKDSLEIMTQRGWNTMEVLLFLKKKLGILAVDDYSGYSYEVDQITNYDEKRAIDHITKYHTLQEKVPHKYFSEDFNVSEFYYRLRNLLPLDDKVYRNITENIYVFRYDHCGKADDKTVDYIRVITLQDSNDIMTMYPYANKERLSCIDLTPVVEELPKVKRMSQIEKFNQRYFKN